MPGANLHSVAAKIFYPPDVCVGPRVPAHAWRGAWDPSPYEPGRCTPHSRPRCRVAIATHDRHGTFARALAWCPAPPPAPAPSTEQSTAQNNLHDSIKYILTNKPTSKPMRRRAPGPGTAKSAPLWTPRRPSPPYHELCSQGAHADACASIAVSGPATALPRAVTQRPARKRPYAMQLHAV